jgi:hypothetical protein
MLIQSLPPIGDIPECATLSPLNISGFVFYSFSKHKFTKSSLPAQKFCASIFNPTFFEKVLNHQSRVQIWVENLCRNEWRINRIILYVLLYLLFFFFFLNMCTNELTPVRFSDIFTACSSTFTIRICMA